MRSEDDLTNENLVVLAVVTEGGLGVAAVAIGWLVGFSPLELVAVDVKGVCFGVVAALPMVGALVLCGRLPWWPFSDVAHVVDRLLRPLFAQCSLAELALISALAGIGEELFFRGLLQAGLAQWIDAGWGVWVALAVSSLLFGLLHPLNGAYVLLATVMGVLLGGLLVVSDNLLVPIITHGLYDFLALVWLVRIQGARGDGPGEPSPE